MTHKKSVIKKISFYIFISLISFFILLPFFWMISTSFKETKALMKVPIQWIPEKVSFDAYEKLFSVFPFGRAIFNSFFVAVMTTFIAVLSASMAAYVFSKIEFKGRNVLFFFFLATMMIPGQVTMIPNYLVLRNLGLLNTYVGVMLPSFFNAFGTFLLRQNMLTIPKSFSEAAIIDGASHFKIFLKIILPLSRPAIATLSIITFMGGWNSYLWPLIVLTDKNKMTLPIGLSLLNGQYSGEYNLLMAGSLISIIPILIVYIFAQKYFMEGLNVGGLKG